MDNHTQYYNQTGNNRISKDDLGQGNPGRNQDTGCSVPSRFGLNGQGSQNRGQDTGVSRADRVLLKGQDNPCRMKTECDSELNNHLVRKYGVLAIDELGLNRPFVGGQDNPVRNCWHFYTDGHKIDRIFEDDDDFICGMNRIFVVNSRYNIVILAFALMDNHLHFILYGELINCRMFMSEYLRMSSMAFNFKYGQSQKMRGTGLSHQGIDNDGYLKTCICYVLRNPVLAGLKYMPYDYPWSSGGLYFRRRDFWNSPVCCNDSQITSSNEVSVHKLRAMLNTKNVPQKEFRIIRGIVYPGEYVAVDIVERLFRTPRAFGYYMGRAREEEVESRCGCISRMTIPDKELIAYRNEMADRLFGVHNIKEMDTVRRVSLAKALKAQYNSSPKQIARIVGLAQSELEAVL